jgi:hypothetical protein
LRGGERLPMVGEPPAGDYFLYVGRVVRKPRCQAIGWPLRSPLPRMPVPLLPEDGDVSVDLQTVFRSAYEPSLYDRRLPYQQALDPRLPPGDEAWVQKRLEEHANSRQN